MSAERDIRLTFDGVAEVYDRARPSYPEALFDVLFAALPVNPQILEIGPGTGQATMSLLDHGAYVIAVELGPTLAQTVEAKFRDNPRLSVVNASFEEADVPVASFDAVTVATAYHWIDARAQIERPIELLRPGGVLGVVDLIQVDSASDHGYFDRVQQIYEAYGGARSSWDPKSYDTVEPGIATRLRESSLYSMVEVHRVPWDQTYTSAEYRDLLWTHSGTQMMTEPSRSAMVDELVAVIDQELDGVVTRPLVATLTLARAATRV